MIQPSKTHKLPGVILDEELHFHEHNKWVHQFKHLSRPCVEMLPVKMWQLYKAIAVLKMLYGCDVMNVPIQRKSDVKRMSGSVGFAMNLARVQCLAATAIMGALYNTATDVLDMHANLLPMVLNINKISQGEAMQYATLSKTYLLCQVIWQSKRYVKWHWFPMHKLLNVFQIDPNTTETIEIARKPAKWKRQFKIVIVPSKGDALMADREGHKERWRVYSDGSEIGGKVGTTAILYRSSRRIQELGYHLDTSKEHTVHEAELVEVS